MPANMSLAYISLPHCGSKLARSSASQSTNSLLIPWVHCRESYNKNVIMLLCGEMGEDKTGGQPSSSTCWAGLIILYCNVQS